MFAITLSSEHHVEQVADVVKSRHVSVSRAGVNLRVTQLAAEHLFCRRKQAVLLAVGETHVTFGLARETVLAENARNFVGVVDNGVGKFLFVNLKRAVAFGRQADRFLQ